MLLPREEPLLREVLLEFTEPLRLVPVYVLVRDVENLLFDTVVRDELELMPRPLRVLRLPDVREETVPRAPSPYPRPLYVPVDEPYRVEVRDEPVADPRPLIPAIA